MVNIGLMQPILAQVNFGGTWSSILGIALAGSGVALYALRSMRPKLARDHDIFFAAVALLCGGILFFQGWRQDPILQFGQFLLTGSAVFFAVESIRLRGIATEQAKRNTPVEDYERPVSRVYRAEFDDALNPYEDERPSRRRIQGTRESRSSRDEYEESVSRRVTRRTNGDERLGPSSSRKRRPRSATGPSSDYPETRGDAELSDDKQSRIRGTSSARSGNQSPSSGRPRRPRPSEDEGSMPPRDRERPRSRDEEAPPSEYVDYRPVEDDEEDNWGDY
jgi:hypothetical protein